LYERENGGDHNNFSCKSFEKFNDDYRRNALKRKSVFAYLPMGQTIGVDFKNMENVFDLVILISNYDGI
jgi:hypothetical protein